MTRKERAVTVETLRRSPLAHLEFPAHSGVHLREVPFLAQVNLRVDPTSPAAGRIGDALGAPLPTDPNTVTTVAELLVMWLGPDEWLIVGPDGQAPQLEAQLRSALADQPGSVVDVSANRTTLELSGPAARQVLEKGCPLDLHPRAFTPGTCAQTLLARANVVLHQVDDAPTYRILVRPSFADYLAEWLLDAMGEFAS
jgi:sarcosine oxidase subunit gamma